MAREILLQNGAGHLPEDKPLLHEIERYAPPRNQVLKYGAVILSAAFVLSTLVYFITQRKAS